MSLQGLYTYSFIVTTSKAYQYIVACLLLAFYITIFIISQHLGFLTLRVRQHRNKIVGDMTGFWAKEVSNAEILYVIIGKTVLCTAPQ